MMNHLWFCVLWVLCFQRCAQSSTLVVLNRLDESVKMSSPESITLSPRGQYGIEIGGPYGLSFGAARVQLEGAKGGNFSAYLPGGLQRYAVLVINAHGGASLHDTNDFQVELSRVAKMCRSLGERETADGSPALACMARKAFAGMPSEVVAKAFAQLWGSSSYWELCNVAPPAHALSVRALRSGKQVEILRNMPLVASVRGFVSHETCAGILESHARPSELTAASLVHDAREMLTSSITVGSSPSGAP